METAWSSVASALALRDAERVTHGAPDDLRVLAVGQGLVPRAAAERSQDVVLGQALGVHITELRAHLQPELSQPHPRQASRTREPRELGPQPTLPVGPL
jgi:hypothetical protein